MKAVRTRTRLKAVVGSTYYQIPANVPELHHGR